MSRRSFLLSHVLQCLAADGSADLAFRALFPDLQAITDCYKTCKVKWAPGLIDALSSTTPPTIAFFESLPYVDTTDFVVYALVIEKLGELTYLYPGSGTSKNGKQCRLCHTFC